MVRIHPDPPTLGANGERDFGFVAPAIFFDLKAKKKWYSFTDIV